MTTKFYRDADGNYIGGYDGAPPPRNAIEIAEPPPHALMRLNGAAWIDTPASTKAKQPEPSLRAIADALEAKALLTRAETGR